MPNSLFDGGVRIDRCRHFCTHLSIRVHARDSLLFASLQSTSTVNCMLHAVEIKQSFCRAPSSSSKLHIASICTAQYKHKQIIVENRKQQKRK